MQLIKSYFDKKNFGNKVDIYKSEEGYIVIMWDRGIISYAYVDQEKKKYIPIDSLIDENAKYDFKKKEFNIQLPNLEKYGFSECPIWLLKIFNSL